MTTKSKYPSARLALSTLSVLAGLTFAAGAVNADKGKSDTIVGLASKADSATTTLRIKGSGTPTFTVYKLDNPSRVVVDIVGTSLSSKLKKGEEKAVWNINSWAVGQVSAHNMSKARGELVRVVVGLSRPSSYQVKASGNDVLVEVTAKSKPSGMDPAALARAQSESASARRAAEQELASARAEASRIRQQAAERDREAKARIAEAEKLMSEAKSKSTAAQEASRLAAAEISRAKQREESAQKAESRASARQSEVERAEAAAKIAMQRAEAARSKNTSDRATLLAQAQAATRAAQERRRQAETATREAEERRLAAEKATELAEKGRLAAASALQRADLERAEAERERDAAMSSSQSADGKRRSAEAAATAAAARAKELSELVLAEESRFESARKLRTQEEAATAKAQAARLRADEQRRVAAAAQKKLTAELQHLSSAKASAELRRRQAEQALARAKQAAADSNVSKSEVKRLHGEAAELANKRDQAEKALSAQESSLLKRRSEVAALNTKKQAAAKGLLAMQQEADAARQRRADEEERLAALSAKRVQMKGQLDEAREMRLAAKEELDRARRARLAAESARSKASAHESAAERALQDAAADARVAKEEARVAKEEARVAKEDARVAKEDARVAKEARSRALAAETVAQREMERAKRARLAAESERRAVAEEMKLAKLQEVAATSRLAQSKRARQDAERERKSAAIAKAKAHETSALKALEQARTERKLAEEARRKGALALEQASEREKQAAVTLARANKAKAAPKVIRPKTRLSDLDVVQRQDMSRVVIAMSSPAAPKVVSNRGTEAVLEIPLAGMRDDQERTLDTSSLRGAVKAVSSYRDPKDPNTLKIVVDLSEPSTGTLKKVGNTYYWDFPKKKSTASVATKGSSKSAAKSVSYATQSVAGYGSASSPITQQTVSQLSRRKRRTYRGQKIDLDYKKSDIHDLMRLLADVGGVNIIVPDDIKARVTIRLRRVPWDQALDVILASKGLGFKMEGPRLFRIATQKELDAEFEAKLARAKAKADSEPPQPEIFNLNYVDAKLVKTQLESLLSPKGSLQVDERSNALIINDVGANRRRIINMLTRLDTQTPQIQIEARIVEARSTFVRQFGIQWGGNATASAAGGNATGLIFPSTIGLGGAADDGQTPTGGLSIAPSNFAVNLPAAIGTGSGGGIGLSLGSVGGNLGLNLRLSALEDEGSVRIISSPKITTSNNILASIKSGVSIPISVVSANGVQTQFVPADLELKVKPSVSLRDCAVSMEIDVKKNEADFVNTGARGDPTLLTKEAKTTILVQDGDTSVIGGIYTRNSGVAYSKVPFFGDLPVFGWLFKTSRENDERTEVLIFITPKITNRAFLPCSE